MPETIETDRLLLRRFTPGDLDELAEVLGNPEVMRFSLGGPYSREKTAEFIDRCLRTYADRGFGMYAAVYRKENRVIGYCGFYFQVIEGLDEVEIGYRLHPDYWGMGLGTEGAMAVQRYGFEQLGLNRMISIIEAENVASIRVAEKNGFICEKESSYKGIPVRIYVVERNQDERENVLQ